MFSLDKVKIKTDFRKIEIILFSQMLDGQRSVLFKMEQLSNEYGAGSRNVKEKWTDCRTILEGNTDCRTVVEGFTDCRRIVEEETYSRTLVEGQKDLD